MLIGHANGFPMTARERLGLSLRSTSINRPHRVNHMLGGKVPAGRDHRLPNRKPPNFADDLPAFGEDGRTSRIMDGPIDSTASQQRRVRRIHNRVSHFFGDVGRPVNLDGLAPIE